MDKSCPTFGHFSVHEQKLMKLSQHLTVFPSHFNNIFLKSFRLLPNLKRNCEILQYLMRFHETNDISGNFSSIILGIRDVVKYFVDFRFRIWYFWKMTAKFQFCLNRFDIFKFWTWWWWKLKKSISQLPTTSEKCLLNCWQNSGDGEGDDSDPRKRCPSSKNGCPRYKTYFVLVARDVS